jgi:hypothetical protein
MKPATNFMQGSPGAGPRELRRNILSLLRAGSAMRNATHNPLASRAIHRVAKQAMLKI